MSDYVLLNYAEGDAQSTRLLFQKMCMADPVSRARPRSKKDRRYRCMLRRKYCDPHDARWRAITDTGFARMRSMARELLKACRTRSFTFSEISSFYFIERLG